tara:strand:+ start:13426 stop:14079 length:654 start_codon:yes stop_codon:yes gene_type:complete
MFLINPYVFGGGGASVPDAVSFWNADNSTDDAFGANNATLVNGATYNASGKVNQAFSLDGLNDEVTAGTNAFSTAAVSISFWIKPSSLPTDACLISYSKGYGSAAWTLYWHAASKLYFTFAGGTVLNSTSSLVAGTWSHVVITYDNSECKIYFDGVLEDTGGAVAPLHNVSDTLYLGSERGAFPIPGLYDATGVWDEVLTQDHVTALYNGGAGLQPF